MDTNENLITEEISVGERSATQLPKPSGYHILLALPESKDTFESGIAKASLTKQQEEVSSVIGFVMAIGPDGYQDKAKFPTGPWCAKGDFVLVHAYHGSRFKIHGKEFRMINDEHVLGVVSDPRGYSRVG